MVDGVRSCEGGQCASISREQLLELLQTAEGGLPSAEAARRLSEFGPNEIQEVRGRPAIFKFLENFYHLFAIMLWVAGGLAFVADMPQLGYAVFSVIFINAIFSFWQEHKAEKATEALKRMMPRRARVVRDGQVVEVPAAELVPGDLLVLEEGDAISADARVIEEYELRVNMATLNGESEPVRKTAGAHTAEHLTAIEMPNLVFAGTSVARGSGRAVVHATGMHTEFGKIAQLTQSVQAELSPLQKEMQKITQLVAFIATGVGITFFVLGYFWGGLELIAGFIFALGIIVALVPEGLLPTVTLALAMGVQRMANRHALIKKLSSVETLGCTTVICTDKTGTLTKNEMTVKDLWVAGQHVEVAGSGYDPAGEYLVDGRPTNPEMMDAIRQLLDTGALCNNARLIAPSNEGVVGEEEPAGWSILGDPTEAALLVAARKAGVDYEAELCGPAQRVYELPFDSVRKRMSTVHACGRGRQVQTKGAPKEILELCSRVLTLAGEETLTDELRAEIMGQNDRFARSGLRVLAMASRRCFEGESTYSTEATERDLTFIGLVAMMDPPRDEVTAAVKQCSDAGIRIIMITGDYGLTAESIARRVGIVHGSGVQILTGNDIADMDDSQLADALRQPEVLFARVSPEHKMRIALALKSLGHVVAMTGDGVNDAPALKAADIGVAMGISGTDVAKEAADMILTDDNFASIVSAIEEGRAVYDNIRRFVAYIFTSNVPELVPFVLFVLFDVPLALTVMQILAIDLGTDMIPALALGTEAPEPGIMKRPPRPRTERLVNGRLLLRAQMYLGSIQATATMAAFFFCFWSFGWRPGMDMHEFGAMAVGGTTVYILATTMNHGAVVTTQIGNGFAQRTSVESIFKVGFFSNKFFIWGIVIELILFSLLVYVPPLAAVFDNGPIRLWPDWAFLLALAPTLLIADEFRKWIVRMRRARETR